MSGKRQILTIGYGDRTIDELLHLVRSNRVNCLVDIRTRPFSRYKPELSRDSLTRTCVTHNLEYEFLGHLLGGQPDDETCYVKGKVNYEACLEKPFVHEGIVKLRGLFEAGLEIALLCSEKKPEQCHRSKLVGVALVQAGIAVSHIDEHGVLQAQAAVMARLNEPSGQFEFFGTTRSRFSRKRHRYER